MPQHSARTVFFISDGTGITAETLGRSLLSQFEGIRFRLVRIPFVTTAAKAEECVRRIRQAAAEDGVRPIVVTTIVDGDGGAALRGTDALVVDFFQTFIAPLETELGVRSTHAIGRFHGVADSIDYLNRMEAVNFTLAHDDGVTDAGLEQADVILIGVSRSGKTPTSLYLALQFGVRAANCPLIPEDFERGQLPGVLHEHRERLFGLSIEPERLHTIRNERRPGSPYASLDNCRYEVAEALKLMARERIRWLDSTTKSIEEISATVIQETGIERRG